MENGWGRTRIKTIAMVGSGTKSWQQGWENIHIQDFLCTKREQILLCKSWDLNDVYMKE